ncbi:MAG TPA: chemotaxis protein CheW [Planctomycetaceae bacterium]|nr:chemotaxis protein CheW [Planctomycetaceae bacterium]
MDDDLLKEFLAESWENLGQLDSEIVTLEKEPNNSDLLASVFRTIHTIKGTCGFIGLARLGKVAHATENVLGKMREGTLAVSSPSISIVLEGIDRIKDLLNGLETAGEEPNLESGDLIHRLDMLASLAEPVAHKPTPPAPSPSPAPAAPVRAAVSEPTPAQFTPVSAPEPIAEARPVASPQSAPIAAKALPQPPAIDPEHDPLQESGKKTISDLSIRVNVDVLDRLMNLVGELVLTRNQLLQMVRGEDESKYAAPIVHLNRVTTDLQEGVMKTRMQPIGNAWNKLPRLVRDLCKVTDKQIELEMSGAETELDRTVLDAIKDPLTHMIRNSADHGVETPPIRLANGKSEIGRICLDAYHEGGHVIIRIEDDGAGINRVRVLKKAIENGLVSEADAAAMPDSEVFKLIFLPGFSTAETISSVSGRGVGMDVVRTAIERIGGTVELNSVLGVGTTVKIKIPLTLAIISALVVESGGETFAIPQLGVVELVRVPFDERQRIERIHSHEVFRLRNRLLPLIHLNDVLQLPEDTAPEDDINIVVVQVGEEQFGLLVSEVFDTQEIVVKPVGTLLRSIKAYQGTTILGDGRVIIILDVAGIASEYGGQASRAAQMEQARQEEDHGIPQESTSLLLFRSAQSGTLAVPLALVSRLEEIPRNQIERSGDRMVVQYRGNLLPLIAMVGYGASSEDAGDMQSVVVFSDGISSVGLLVEEIEDIIDEPLTIRMASQRPGTLGTAIINGKATDVLDTQHYLTQVYPDWFRGDKVKKARRLLVVDDSMFFRQLARTALEADGYRVHTASSASDAMTILEHDPHFDGIICDIEMPQVDGCQFAEWARKRPGTIELPLIAMTSLDGDVHGERILGAGFDEMLMKFNPSQLMSTLKRIFQNVDRQRGKSA